MRSSLGRITSSRASSTVPKPAAATAAGLAVLAVHDKQLLQQLAHDLAALLARKLLHRWQQHTADAKVDRARAKPMQKLLRCVA
jgi:glutamate-1-semialdehyde aminotransferase